MRKKLLTATKFSLLFISILLLFTSPVRAQTPTPQTPTDELIAKIEARAQTDVEMKKPAESVAGLDVLFGEEAETIGMSIAEVLDIYEAAYLTATPELTSWEAIWKSIQPFVTFAGILALLVLVFQKFLQEMLTNFIKNIAEKAINNLARFRPFWGIALRRYRKALSDRYKEEKIPFRPGRPLEMKDVYVPLRTTEANNPNTKDAYQAISEYKWLMIVGEPGSGKSILMKHMALTYARGELEKIPNNPIPILLELNRFNDSNKNIEAHLLDILENNQFENATNFLNTGLDHGMFLLLFDGFDEVNKSKRDLVTNQIKDLLHKHQSCRAVVTCRTLVYNEEFSDWADQKLEIAPFSDQQIQQFLQSWQKDMKAGGKSIEHLLRNLRERPRIMMLARNPLLLTIIAYLYTDTVFALPHSRSAFYSTAITVLLEQWKETVNKYKASHKRLVLQHLALFNQDQSLKQNNDGKDRRSIDLKVILQEIKKVLPSLTLKEGDVQPILDEIVERSGLLITIDGGTKYQFAHLTLQEFFAAMALATDGEGLLERYEKDTGAWRETVKLWCGLEHDSTQLLSTLYKKDPMMAFESLGDAQQVDTALANQMLEEFEPKLGLTDDNNETLIEAFAAVSTNPGQRGQGILNILSGILGNEAEVLPRRLAAAESLAATNLPIAADIIGKSTLNQKQISATLVKMGDLAVPVLSAWLAENQIWAMEALFIIGTPEATQALIPCLYQDDPDFSYPASWYLSALLSKTGIEDMLLEYNLSQSNQSAPRLDWVWAPFDNNSNAPNRIIIERIAYLIHSSPDQYVPFEGQAPDKRLVIALCTVAAQTEKINLKLGKKLLTKLREENVELENLALDDFCKDHGWQFMVKSLQNKLQLEILECVTNKPTVSNWKNIFKPLDYEFSKSIHSILVLIISFGYLGLSIWSIIIYSLSLWPGIKWNVLWFSIPVALISFIYWAALYLDWDVDNATILVFGLLFPGISIHAYYQINHLGLHLSLGIFLLISAFSSIAISSNKGDIFDMLKKFMHNSPTHLLVYYLSFIAFNLLNNSSSNLKNELLLPFIIAVILSTNLLVFENRINYKTIIQEIFDWNHLLLYFIIILAIFPGSFLANISNSFLLLHLNIQEVVLIFFTVYALLLIISWDGNRRQNLSNNPLKYLFTKDTNLDTDSLNPKSKNSILTRSRVIHKQ